jgi:hypothetical protein
MGQKLDIFKIWPPDFAQKNIYFILNLSKTICELILPKKLSVKNEKNTNLNFWDKIKIG